ncbi:Yip1 member 1 [Dermatophagoides farinae]|uniref:Yip1 member 1 n=1 Tax=Dermatophagoides farinae TaxID=6954 RepID=A0A922I2V0_DERFA|nr:Yip1 member 1 [Dermatophagoides farinae]
MDSNNKPTDSAILFLDSAFEPKQPSTNQQQPMDGHQILNQVQLQFIPTDTKCTTTTTQQQETTRSYVMEPSVIVTGSNQQQKTRDTDFLVDNDDTQPIDLGSPVRSHDGTTGNGNHKKLTIWQFDYYARYFDITTDQFFRRIIWSLVPLTMGNEKGTYIDRYIHSNPDLYGPFWIPLTLAFTISFCDDIIRYMNINSITSATTTTITPIGIDSTTMNKTLIPSPPTTTATSSSIGIRI